MSNNQGGLRLYVWRRCGQAEADWRHPLEELPPGAVDCTDMDDAQFEQHIRRVTNGQ